ncbi:hypothetical protein JJ821_003399 [Salmonella enterica]|nr:hypothetical protein [Salmonella enterica subsp. enterica serovar Luke]EEA8599427.1 hypothetical protein [Salmonella enterica subsp. enterica]EHA1150453.1 hypothetical protein [Salmonella enterica]HAF1383559.1 hypothetical protein [Salmonella enterica]HAF5718256.1 hypothetical protein [Salmonella enterica]
MAKMCIRVLSFLLFIIAVSSAWLTHNPTWYFTGAAFFLTFLGTFVFSKPSSSGHQISQKGGAFSRNNQVVNFGTSSEKGNDRGGRK